MPTAWTFSIITLLTGLPAAGQTMNAPPSNRSAFTAHHILLMKDGSAVRDVIAEYLCGEGFNVDTPANQD